MDTLTIATIAANTAMGLVYVAYGLITLSSVRKQQASRGNRHLAYGFSAIMWTCGPHHLEHAAHLATGQGAASWLDLATVGIGIPVGLTWFLLRVEGGRGGRGDRVVRSDLAVDAYRTMWAGAGVLTLATVIAVPAAGPGWGGQVLTARLLPNILVAVLYLAVSAVLLRTQLRRHTVDGTWSLSGLSLTAVFASCAGMHAMLVSTLATGVYAPDAHLLTIDLISIPATLYFLGVVWLTGEGHLTSDSEAATDVVLPDGVAPAELADAHHAPA